MGIKFRLVVTLLLLVLCTPFLLLAQQKTNANIIHIPAGKNTAVIYNLAEGSYDITFNGKKYITGTTAQWGNNLIAGDHSSRTYSSIPLNDAFGKGTLHFINQEINGLHIQQLFYTYPGKPYFFVQVRVLGQGAAFNYMSPMANAHITPVNGGDKRALYVPFDNDMWARYDAKALDSASFTGSEVTAIYSNQTRQGLVLGSIEHEVWKSGIKLANQPGSSLLLTAFAGLTDSVITHDKILHGKVTAGDSICSSPRIMIGLFNDWRDGMEQYAAANKIAEKPYIANWNKGTPIGWNSWGAMQGKINLEKAKKVVDFFSDSIKNFRNSDGTLYIDLDSYWDNMVKGGLGGDVSALQSFVDYCHQHHFKPGIYWGPFADWAKRDRKIEGSDYNYSQSWIKQNGVPVEVDGARAMDPTFPGTKQRILFFLNHFKQLGFEMIKIDFLGHGAMENDRFFDTSVTTGMQAYKQGMQFIDSVLDNKMLVYAAISPTMATGRYVHMRRIACDAFSSIDNTEYTVNSTGYGWWQSKLYNYVDADHIVFGKEGEGANRARLASALVTGTLITGDDYAQSGPWLVGAKSLLQNQQVLKLFKNGHSFRPVEANTGKAAVEIFTSGIDGAAYLVVFNYSKAPKHYTIPLDRLGMGKVVAVSITELFSGQLLPVNSKNINIDMPAADAAIYRIIKVKN